jgi:hypothetical protein
VCERCGGGGGSQRRSRSRSCAQLPERAALPLMLPPGRRQQGQAGPPGHLGAEPARPSIRPCLPTLAPPALLLAPPAGPR